MAQPALNGDRVPGCLQHLVEPALQERAVGRVHQVGQPVTDPGGGGLAKESLGRGALEANQPFWIGDGDDV